MSDDFINRILPMITLFVMIALTIWGIRRLLAAPQAPNVPPELSKRLYKTGYRLSPDSSTPDRTSWSTGWVRHGGLITLDRSRARWSMTAILHNDVLQSRPGLTLVLGAAGSAARGVPIDTQSAAVVAHARYEKRDDVVTIDDEARVWLELLARGCAPLLAATRGSFAISVTNEAPRVWLTLEELPADPNCFDAGRTLIETAATQIAGLPKRRA